MAATLPTLIFPPGLFVFLKVKDGRCPPVKEKTAAASKRHHEELLRRVTLSVHGSSVQLFFEEHMATLPVKTPTAAKRLGVTYSLLCGLIRREQVPVPRKDESGDYVWSPEDIERARNAIAKRRQRKAVPA